MNRPRRHAFVALLLAISLGCEARLEGSSAWRTDPLWDDGNAEFCAYEVDWYRYGRLNAGRALLIVVKEPWAPDLEVKADTPRPDGFDVLKLNHVRDVSTGIYTYHQMASVFVRRQSGELQKLAATSSEGCGISTAQMTGGTLTTSSYFDGQGDERWDYPPGALAEDGLPMTLRDFLDGETPTKVEVFPSLMAGRFPSLDVATYRVERQKVSAVQVPAGSFDAIEIKLIDGTRWMAYTFDSRPPHALVRATRDDGTVYRLAKCERIPYWDMNIPGGEDWLPVSVR